MWDGVKVKSPGMGHVSQPPPTWLQHHYRHHLLGAAAIIALQGRIANYPVTLLYQVVGEGELTYTRRNIACIVQRIIE